MTSISTPLVTSTNSVYSPGRVTSSLTTGPEPSYSSTSSELGSSNPTASAATQLVGTSVHTTQATVRDTRQYEWETTSTAISTETVTSSTMYNNLSQSSQPGTMCTEVPSVSTSMLTLPCQAYSCPRQEHSFLTHVINSRATSTVTDSYHANSVSDGTVTDRYHPNTVSDGEDVPSPAPSTDREEIQSIQKGERYLQQEVFSETLAAMDPERQASLGDTLQEFILDCQYRGVTCSTR